MKCLLLIFVLVGCAEVVTPADSSRYAPASGKPKKGEVIYNPDGFKDLVDQRRQDALKKIYDICGNNKYKMTESIEPTHGLVSSGIATAGASRVDRIQFECL